MENRLKICGIHIDLGPLGYLFRRPGGSISRNTISADLGGYRVNSSISRGIGRGRSPERDQNLHQMLIRRGQTAGKTCIDLRDGRLDASLGIQANGLPEAHYVFRNGSCHLRVERGSGQEVVVVPAREGSHKLVITV